MFHTCGQQQKTGQKWPRCECVEPNECEARCCWQKHASWIEFSWMYKDWKNNCRSFDGMNVVLESCDILLTCAFSGVRLTCASMQLPQPPSHILTSIVRARLLHLLYVSDRVKLTVKYLLSVLCKKEAWSSRRMQKSFTDHREKNMHVWRWACVLGCCVCVCGSLHFPCFQIDQ